MRCFPLVHLYILAVQQKLYFNEMDIRVLDTHFHTHTHKIYK